MLGLGLVGILVLLYSEHLTLKEIAARMPRASMIDEPSDIEQLSSWRCTTAPGGLVVVRTTRKTLPGGELEPVDDWNKAHDARVAQKRIEFPPGT